MSDQRHQRARCDDVVRDNWSNVSPALLHLRGWSVRGVIVVLLGLFWLGFKPDPLFFSMNISVVGFYFQALFNTE